MAAPVPPELLDLARAHGIDTAYDPGTGAEPVPVSARTLVAVLASLGVEVGDPAAMDPEAPGAGAPGAGGGEAVDPEAVAAAARRLRERAEERLLPPCVVMRRGRERELRLPFDAEAWLELEDGSVREFAFSRLPADLPAGRHTLCARTASRAAAAPLIVAPDRVPGPPGRSWGYLVQLYSVLSQRSWGIGDLGDLAELARWSGHAHGAGFLQVNPLHAAMPGDPSPYRPSSRRFPDPVHLRVEAVPEAAYLTGAELRRVEEAAARAGGLREDVLRHDGLIDREAAWALKREALRAVHAVPRGPGREAAYRAYRAREGARLTDHATWCALAERHGTAWRAWPAPLRDPGSAAVAAAREELAEEVEFHCWLQWCLDEQLAQAQRAARDAGMPVGIVHDLAVGAHPEGADAWAQQRFLASGISVGAPPDAFNARGQDWGLPPWRPDTLAASGYAPFADLLRGALSRAGGLRVDHVMGLFRLWWIPEGRPPTEGTYVRYDSEAMLGVLALEAERAGAVVIGEDLGTVEPGVREALAGRGILGTSVLWFERDWAAEPATGPDQAGPDQAASDRAAPERAAPDRAGSGRVVADLPGPDQAAPDRAESDRAGSGRGGAGLAAPDQAAPDQAVRDRAESDRAAPEHAAPAQDPLDQAASHRAVSDQAGSGRGGAGLTAPDQAAPDQVGSGQVGSGQPSRGEVADQPAPRRPDAVGEAARPLPPDRWRAQCLATLTTHDLPSTAARLSGEHVELRHRLGLLTRPLEEAQAEADEEREEWLGELAREGLLSRTPYGEGPAADGGWTAPVGGQAGELGRLGHGGREAGELPPEVAALHRYLLRTPAALVGVWLPDSVGDPRPQNLPGTFAEYPNWRLPVADGAGRPLALEEIAAAPSTRALAELMRDGLAAGQDDGAPSGPPPEPAPPSGSGPGPGPYLGSGPYPDGLGGDGPHPPLARQDSH